MKKLIIAGCISTLIACGNTNEFDSNLDAQVSKPSGPASSAQPASTQGANLPVITQPTQLNSQPVVTTTTTPVTTTQPQQSTAAGMNPPHGQPGHRCDIEVGAPLNSAPKQTTKTTTASAVPQNISVSPITTTPVKTAPGMNPPHGQPGHRCDIEVGAPLNSAPKANTTATPVTPVKQEETKPAAEQWKAEVKPAAKPDSSRN